jgi:hypothetical protein
MKKEAVLWEQQLTESLDRIDSEQHLLDSLADTVANHDDDDDDEVECDFKWEDMSKYMRQREQPTGGLRPQGASTATNNILGTF